MRCRKVRSFLSAYCRDDLTGSHRRRVSEHLLACPGCRREESLYRDLSEAVPAISSLKVSEDFNQRLLQRVAQERFAETRTRAYLPKNAPLLVWRKVVPAVATACVAILAVFATMTPTLDDPGRHYAATGSGLDDSYMTAQPDANPNMTVQLKDDWSLTDHLARTERINRISNSVTPAGGFLQTGYSDGLAMLASADNQRTPFVANYYKMRPVVRVYVVPQTAVDKRGSDAY